MTDTNATNVEATPAADQTPAPAANPADDAAKAQGNEPAATDTPAAAAEGDKPAADKAKGDNDSLLFNEDGDEKPKDTEGDKDPEKDGDKEKEGEEGDETPTFDLEKLTIPEDMPIPDEVKEEVSALAKELENADLTTQEKMQKMTDLHVKLMNQQAEKWTEIKAGWRKEVEADPDVGGEKLKAITGDINNLVRQFGKNPEFGGSDELFDDLKTDLMLLGLGNKKSFIKFMNNVAKATKGDSIAGGKTGPSAEKLGHEKVLFPNMA